MADNIIDVSLVMPCLNEEITLPACIDEAKQTLEILKEKHDLLGEIVVADNGSTDRSIEISEKMGARVVHISDKGYGNAVKGGISQANGRYIVMGDADWSYDFRESVEIIEKLVEGYDLCIGNRFSGNIMPGAMPWKNRYIGNPLLSGVLNLLFRSGLLDAHVGLRGFSKEAFYKMGLTSPGMEFASEMVIKATLLDLSRTEVPVTLRPDGRDRPPHLRPFRDGWRHLRYIFMLSPAWLYFIPSILFGIFSLVIFSVLVFTPDNRMVPIGPFFFGDHWVIISSILLAACHQAIIFGLATTLYGLKFGYRKMTRRYKKIFDLLSLEKLLIFGLVGILVGFVLILRVYAAWSSQGFSSLARIRETTLAMTFGLIGIQNIFGGFLLSIIGGNEAKFAADNKLG